MCKKEIFIILLSISIFIAFIVPIRAYEVLPPMSTDIFVEYVLKTYVLMVAGCIFSFACFWVVRRIWAVLAAFEKYKFHRSPTAMFFIPCPEKE